MNRPILFVGLLIAPLIAQEPPIKQSPATKEITQICFGSCHRTGRNAQIWQQISKQEPQLFLFMGDNVYADTLEPKRIVAHYAKLNATPEYQALKKNTQVLATWDDHDYGLNDMGKENPVKEQSKKALLDAFDVPEKAPVRTRPGIYQSYTYGPQGKQLQVILLDTRSFRSPLQKVRKSYVPIKGENVTLLGKAQWKWLEEQLQQPADARLIVSSIQMLNEGHRYEKWGNMPEERQRFIELLNTTKNTHKTFILSGDRHFGEISKLQTEGQPDLWEITSSGMTHAGGGWDDNNPLRVGKRMGSRNFGSLHITWGPQPTFQFAIHDNEGAKVQQQTVTLTQP